MAGLVKARDPRGGRPSAVAADALASPEFGKANAAAAQPGPGAEADSAAEPKKDEGVIDAEYVDVDDKK